MSRRRRRRIGISPLGLVPVPLLLHSSGNGGSVEVVLPWWRCCTGGSRRRLVVLRGACRPFASRVRRLLRAVWEFGGWIWLDSLAAAVGVDDELRSKVEGTRGVSPADGRPAMASSSAAQLKAFVRWGSLRPLGVRWPEPASSGGERCCFRRA